MIEKIISGGQTGGDAGGLLAGLALGLKTGGTAPKGYRSELGYDPEWVQFLKDMNLKEHTSEKYPPRTEKNVVDADLTVIFGDVTSRGCSLTQRLCVDHGKPCILVAWTSGGPLPALEHLADAFWHYRPTVVNVAGNRESSQPGIAEAAETYIRDSVNLYHKWREVQEAQEEVAFLALLAEMNNA